jgi:hypothetical protein
MTALLDLAERCEKAEGSDQDALLQEAWGLLFPKPDRADEPEWQGVPGTLREPLFHDWKVRQLAFQALLSAKAFVDAALTLVPEGYLLGLTNVADGAAPDFSKATALVARLPDEQTQPAVAASMALAICAAALRARAANA